MSNRRRIYFATPIFLLLFLIIVPTAFGAQKTIYEYDSTYHHIRVVEEGSIRGLKFDNNYWQSKMDLNDPLAGQFGYISLFFDSFLFKSDIENVLMLGLGGGSVQKQFHHYRPDLKLLSVELDPAVLDVAERFFYLDSEAVPVKISDARSYLNSSRDKYDLIIQDTYSSNTYGTFIPFHLATKEFF
ncbi:MAG: fused MFS/spermidine synthase, partial [bacterium]